MKYILNESIPLVHGGVETLGMEMTDIEQDQVGASAEPQRNPKEMNVGTGQNGEEEYPDILHVDGFEEFEEFVLDFDDYDLLESIHSHLNSPVEPICEYCQQHGLGGNWVALDHIVIANGCAEHNSYWRGYVVLTYYKKTACS